MSLADLAGKYPADETRFVLVTEVTRMSGGRVCVAGLNIHDGTMVRPLQPSGANWEEAKWVPKFMKVGNLLSLEAAAKGTSDYPHRTEDFRVSKVTLLEEVPADQLYEACAVTADDSIDDIFDDELKEDKYIDDKTECRSLGCVIVEKNKLTANVSYDKPHLNMHLGGFDWYNPSITELGLRSGSAESARDQLQARIAGATKPPAIRLGLARAWAGTGENTYDPKRCYLQVNGIICV
jgi:hypothetical protein